MTWYPVEEGARRPRRAPLAIAVIAVVGAVVLGVRWADDPGHLAPMAGVATTEGQVTGARVTADEQTTGLVDPGEEIAQIAGQVADVRGLPLNDPVDARLLDAAALRAVLADLTAGDGGATGEVASRARLLGALRMVPRNRDLASGLSVLQGDQAVGLYVPAERRFYVRDEGRTTPQLRWASAHELVHALQHQHVDVEGLLTQPVGALDAELAALALLEGDAVVTQEAWSQRFQTTTERGRLGEGAAVPPLPVGGEVASYLGERFTFPYDAGARFVVALLEQGGFAAVDAALVDPPRTTAEILEPERYLAGLDVVEVPIEVDPAGGWEPSRDDELGAFDLRELLRPLGAYRAEELVLGWSGGRVRSWERGGEVAVAAAVAFDDAERASALCAALPGWWRVAARAEDAGVRLLSSPEGWMAFRCDGRVIRFGVGPDEDLVRVLAG